MTSGKTFVSDAIDSTFTFFKSDGTTPYRYKDPDLKWPRGFCLDGDDNAIVCDNVSHNVQIITAEGNLHKIFLRDVDGIKSPMSVLTDTRTIQWLLAVKIKMCYSWAKTVSRNIYIRLY